ncbi:MAG: hypothetical protein ACLFTB_04355 [Desulfovibrionales bacterium]
MKAKIHALPGDNCAFYKSGRCHYEESLNPGFNFRFRCRLLVFWEDRFEEFITRAERFHLDPGTAGRIWSDRMRSFQEENTICQAFERGGEASEIGCLHAHLDICILALPSCTGQCAHYRPVRSKG